MNIKSRLKKGGLDFRETADGYNTIIDLQQLEINSVQDVLNCLRVGIQVDKENKIMLKIVIE